MNWIQGQPLGKKLKAIICVDGIWNLASEFYASDTVYEACNDNGGKHYWEDRDGWLKNDPAQFLHNWSTPMLVVHSDKDFRCPLTQGIAAFMVCQARGIPSRLLNFPEESHMVTGRENQLHMWRTMIGWMNKWVGMEGGIELAPPVSQPELKHLDGEDESLVWKWRPSTGSGRLCTGDPKLTATRR